MRYYHDKVCIDADPRHSEIIVRDLALVGQRGSRVPATKNAAKKAAAGKDADGDLEADGESDVEVEYLDAADAKRFRARAARLNYVASERPELQYSVKEVARHLARPHVGSWNLLKKIGRYLLLMGCAPAADPAFCWSSSNVSVFHPCHVYGNGSLTMHTAHCNMVYCLFWTSVA